MTTEELAKLLQFEFPDRCKQYWTEYTDLARFILERERLAVEEYVKAMNKHLEVEVVRVKEPT